MQTDQVTWDEIIQEPKDEVNALAPVTDVTTASLLASAGGAQNELQMASRACHREMTFGANELDDNFQLQIDDDIWRITSISRISDDGRMLGSITPVTLPQLRSILSGRKDGHLQSYQGVNVHSSAPHFAAFDQRKLFFNADFADDENILINYDPWLLPFSARRALIGGDWEGADGDNIGDWITDHGPETEFWGELAGIKGFVGMKLLQSLGSSYVKMNYGAYLRFKSSWERSLENVAAHQTNNSANNAAPSYGGPVN